MLRKFIVKRENKIVREYISTNQKLSEKFVENMKLRLIEQYFTISEKFMKKYKNKIDKEMIIIKNYELLKILHISIILNDEIINTKKIGDIKIFFFYSNKIEYFYLDY
jgi:hypothetical protein